VRFSLVAGGSVLHRRQGREEGRKPFQIPLCAWTFSAAAIGFTHRQWRPLMEKTRRHCSRRPRVSQHCSSVLEAAMMSPALF